MLHHTLTPCAFLRHPQDNRCILRTWQANESAACTNTCEQGKGRYTQVEPGDDDDNAARDEDAKDEQENTAKICDGDYHANMLPMMPADVHATLAGWAAVLSGLESGVEIGPEIWVCFRAQIAGQKWNHFRGNLQ